MMRRGSGASGRSQEVDTSTTKAKDIPHTIAKLAPTTIKFDYFTPPNASAPGVWGQAYDYTSAWDDEDINSSGFDYFSADLGIGDEYDVADEEANVTEIEWPRPRSSSSKVAPKKAHSADGSEDELDMDDYDDTSNGGIVQRATHLVSTAKDVIGVLWNIGVGRGLLG